MQWGIERQISCLPALKGARTGGGGVYIANISFMPGEQQIICWKLMVSVSGTKVSAKDFMNTKYSPLYSDSTEVGRLPCTWSTRALVCA